MKKSISFTTFASAALLFAVFVLSGCNVDRESRIQVLLSDAEAEDLDNSRYSITRVELIDATGEVTTLLDDHVEFDAFHLAGGQKGELVDEEVEPGSYGQLRIQMSRESMWNDDEDPLSDDEDVMGEEDIIDTSDEMGDDEMAEGNASDEGIESDPRRARQGNVESVTETIPLQNVSLSDDSVLRITLDLNGTATEPHIDTRDVQVLDRNAAEADTNFVDLREGLESMEAGARRMVDSTDAALDSLGNRIDGDDDY